MPSFSQTIVLPGPGAQQPGSFQSASAADSIAFANADSGAYDITDAVITVNNGQIGDDVIVFQGALMPFIWPGRINGDVLEADEVEWLFDYTADPESNGREPFLWSDGKHFAIYSIDTTYKAGNGTITATVDGRQLNTVTITIEEGDGSGGEGGLL